MALTDELLRLKQNTGCHIRLPHTHAPSTLHWLDADSDPLATWPELDDVEEELADYAPLALADEPGHEPRCLLVQRQSPHAVYVFHDGLREISPSLSVFIASLLERGPTFEQVLARASEDVGKLLDAGNHASAVTLLRGVLAGTPHTPSDSLPREQAKLLAALWTDLGVALCGTGEATHAAEAYDVAADLGSRAAAENLLTMAMDASDWQRARDCVERLRSWHHPPEALGALRVREIQVWACLGDHARALAVGNAHAVYLADLARKQRAHAEALRAVFLDAIGARELGQPAQALADDAVAPLRAPLPAAATVSDGDVATALRLIKSGKRAQLKSLVERLPALAQMPVLLDALRALPEGASRTELLQVLERAVPVTR